MNVFSEAAIVELGAFARWLAASDVRGAVIRSGKDSAFCAGADLGELGLAYEMIMKTPTTARFNGSLRSLLPIEPRHPRAGNVRVSRLLPPSSDWLWAAAANSRLAHIIGC